MSRKHATNIARERQADADRYEHQLRVLTISVEMYLNAKRPNGVVELPKETPEQTAARDAAIQRALVAAATARTTQPRFRASRAIDMS